MFQVSVPMSELMGFSNTQCVGSQQVLASEYSQPEYEPHTSLFVFWFLSFTTHR